MYYGLYAPETLSLSDVLFHGEKPEQAISSTEFGVDVLRSSTALMAAEELMDQRKMNGQRYNDLFVNVLSALESRYDYILIDCPPQGYKLLENIQLYADYLLIPMIADEFALHSLRLKAEKILEIRKNLNPRLRLLGWSDCHGREKQNHRHLPGRFAVAERPSFFQSDGPKEYCAAASDQFT